LVLAHGFTQNARCWGPFGDDLATDHEVVAVDLPGHGLTPSDHDHADLATAGRLLGEAGGAGVYVGYSMGGRVALHTALDAPHAVEGLVLIGATAGLDEPGERLARRQADEAVAERLLAVGLPAFLDAWLANPLFAGLGPEAACLEARLDNRPEGLAASLHWCGTGTQEPLWDRLRAIDVPVLVVAGSHDPKFTALGTRLVSALPRADLVIVPGTHCVHLENPAVTAAAVRRYLARLA
jgi:2-succinyl-6-hydroxy-2,4-cyclohexadiene-1-carboxylate synthase